MRKASAIKNNDKFLKCSHQFVSRVRPWMNVEFNQLATLARSRETEKNLDLGFDSRKSGSASSPPVAPQGN